MQSKISFIIGVGKRVTGHISVRLLLINNKLELYSMSAFRGNFTSTTIQQRPFSRSPYPRVIGEINDVTDGYMAITVALLAASLNVAETYVPGRKAKKQSKPEHFILTLSVADLLAAIIFLLSGIATILGV